MAPFRPDPNPKRPDDVALDKDRGWVSLQQFQAIAGISYPTVLRWARLKMINVIQFGGQRRVYQEELIRFLKEGTLPPDPELWKAERAKQLADHERWRTNKERKAQGLPPLKSPNKPGTRSY